MIRLSGGRDRRRHGDGHRAFVQVAWSVMVSHRRPLSGLMGSFMGQLRTSKTLPRMTRNRLPALCSAEKYEPINTIRQHHYTRAVRELGQS